MILMGKVGAYLRPINFILGALTTLIIVHFQISSHQFPKSSPIASEKREYETQNVLTFNTTVAVNATSIGEPPAPLPTEEAADLDPTGLKNIGNGTLGFEKILVIGLPERSDRRDTVTLVTGDQGIDIEWIDGVRGGDIPRKSRPLHWNEGNGKAMTDAELGCWRAHGNALRNIVANRYSSALILEDDVDWDTGVRDQLTEMAKLSQEHARPSYSMNMAPISTSDVESPYGANWDLLWLGSCANPPPDHSAIKYHDPRGRLSFFWSVSKGMTCTWAYAITLEAAKSLLAWNQDINNPLDFHMARFCEKHACKAVWPALFVSHRPAGDWRRGTDIQDGGADIPANGTVDWSKIRKKAETPGVVRSSLLELQHKYGPPEEVLTPRPAD